MQALERDIKQLKSTYTVDIVFLLIGIGGIGAGTSQSTLTFTVIGGVFAALGVLMFFTSYNRNKDYSFILQNYTSFPVESLELINKIIEKQKKAIAVDQRKSTGNNREARDSARDVIRKTAKLDIMLAVKEVVEQYN